MSQSPRTPPPPDDLLRVLQGAAQGEPSAWERLVGLYGRRVYALARSRCKDPDVAEEITQSVFATLAAKMRGGEYSERGRFESWLFRVAMNRVRDYVRRTKRRPESLAQDPADARPAPAQADRAEGPLLADLRGAMDQLSEADREIVALRHHGGMSFKQIAELLNEPLGTLLARHHRALRKLREILESSASTAREALP